jgi:hypothetical protein
MISSLAYFFGNRLVKKLQSFEYRRAPYVISFGLRKDGKSYGQIKGL